jgi:cyclic pyranopterin monophosphate synthase
MSSGEEAAISHLGADGAPRMVDVSAKEESLRVATASGVIRMAAGTLTAARAGAGPKGDIFSVASLAGVMAAKRTPELIPLCHSLPLHGVELSIDPDDGLPGIRVTAVARTVARTGVEMEALTAVSIALLTVYDMLKGVDPGMTISDIVLLSKTGGGSGRKSRVAGISPAP